VQRSRNKEKKEKKEKEEIIKFQNIGIRSK